MSESARIRRRPAGRSAGTSPDSAADGTRSREWAGLENHPLWRKPMKKIPLVFVLDRASGALVPDVRPESAWVLAGEGIATVKHDGTATRWQDGRLWRRYDRKLDKQAQRRHDRGEVLAPRDESPFKQAPAGFEACNAQPDPVTFHWPGWVPIDANDAADQWH